MQQDPIEDAINGLSDHDLNWWPFLWLRPEKHEDLTLSRVSMLAILYGIPCGAMLAIALTVSLHLSRNAGLFMALAFPLTCLFAGSVVIAPMWNRRAKRLRARDVAPI